MHQNYHFILYFIVSNLALEPNGEGRCEMKHIPLVEKKSKTSDPDGSKDLLLVMEGEIDISIESALLAMLQYSTYLLKVVQYKLFIL